MSILSAHSPHRFDLFRRSMLQADALPLIEVLADPLIEEVFLENHVNFGIADEDVFTPAVTLWAMISQFLFSKQGRSCKVGRLVPSIFGGMVGTRNVPPTYLLTWLAPIGMAGTDRERGSPLQGPRNQNPPLCKLLKNETAQSPSSRLPQRS